MRYRRQSLWTRFVRNGGVLWANPGAVLDVRHLIGVHSTDNPEVNGWPGQFVLTEYQIAWAAAKGSSSSHGLVSLLAVRSLKQEGPQLRIGFLEGNPRQPVTFKGLLGQIMADTAQAPHEAKFAFRREREAGEAAQRVQRQVTAALDRWPGLTASPTGDLSGDG